MLTAALTVRSTALSIARSVSWGRVLLAAALASALTFVLMNAAVYGPRYAGVTGEDLALVAEFAGGPGAALAFFCAVLYRAHHAALGAGELPGAHAMAAGVLSALCLQLIFALLAPPVYVSETLLYLALGLGAGALASWLVQRRLASRSLLYRASAQMRAQPTPDGIASMIGHAMSRTRPDSVLLWERPRPAAGGGVFGPLLPRGAWVSPLSPPLPVEGVERCAEAFNAALEANGGTWALVNARRTEPCAPWRRRGVGQLLVIALRDTPTPPGAQGAPHEATTAAGSFPSGLLTVGLRARAHLPTSTRDDYLFLAQQAAGALETARLLDNARDAAKRASDHENRKRLAQELHDTIKNRWLGVGMVVEAILADVPEGPRFDGLREKLRLIRQEVENAQRQQRSIIASMRSLDQESSQAATLVSDLKARAEYWSGASGVKVSFATVDVTDPLPRGADLHLRSILEETLANIAAHARASTVRIALTAHAGELGPAGGRPGERRALTLTVADDGVGGAPMDGSHTNGSGLNGIRDRVRELGGRLEIASPAGGGTAITVDVPGPPHRPGTEPDTEQATQQPVGRTP